MVMGAIVPVVNIEGIKPGELVFDGETLAKIYLGTITKWNDPAIAKLNPKLKLPSDAITVVRRSDGSGTTFNFTDYLSKASADWKSKVGSGTAVEWPVGGGAQGNEGDAGFRGQADRKDLVGRYQELSAVIPGRRQGSARSAAHGDEPGIQHHVRLLDSGFARRARPGMTKAPALQRTASQELRAALRPG